MRQPFFLLVWLGVFLGSSPTFAIQCAKTLPVDELKWCQTIDLAVSGHSCKKSPDADACEALKKIVKGKSCAEIKDEKEGLICGAVETGIIAGMRNVACSDVIEEYSGAFAKGSRAVALCSFGSHLAENYDEVIDQIHTARATQKQIDPVLLPFRKKEHHGCCQDDNHGVVGKKSDSHIGQLATSLSAASHHAGGPTDLHLDEYRISKTEKEKITKWVLRSLKQLWSRVKKDHVEGTESKIGLKQANQLVKDLVPRLAESIHFFNSHRKHLTKKSKQIGKSLYFARGEAVEDGFHAPLGFEVLPNGKIILQLGVSVGSGAFKEITLGADLDTGEMYAVGNFRDVEGGEKKQEAEIKMQENLQEARREMELQSEVSKHLKGVTPALPVVENEKGKVITHTRLADMTLRDFSSLLGHEGRVSFNGRDKTEVARLVAVKLIEVVSSLESHGINHRDLKPENFLISMHPNGTIDVEVTDFGFALDLKKPHGKEEAKIEGSPPYIAPGLVTAFNNNTADLAQFTNYDGFALGRILYDLLPRDSAPGSEAGSESSSSKYSDTASSAERDSSSGKRETSSFSGSTQREESFKAEGINRAELFFKSAAKVKTARDLTDPHGYNMSFSEKAYSRHEGQMPPKTFDEIILGLVEPDPKKKLSSKEALHLAKSVYGASGTKSSFVPVRPEKKKSKIRKRVQIKQVVEGGLNNDPDSWGEYFLTP